jgi:hypothetical protein
LHCALCSYKSLFFYKVLFDYTALQCTAHEIIFLTVNNFIS